MRRRLTSAGYRSELVEGAIDRLIELGMLDDDVFARSWVESRDRARPRGEHALRDELRLKGIDSERAYAAKEIKGLKETTERADEAPPVIKKIHKKGTAADPPRGLFEVTIGGKPAVVEYEPDPDLRDTEQVPLL